MKPKFLLELRKRASSDGWGKKKLTRIDEMVKRDVLKRTGRVRRKTGVWEIKSRV